MAQFRWDLDAPSGVYKNRTMSNKLRFAAIAATKFVQFCRTEPGFGKRKGESITLTKVSNLAVPTTAVLSEGTRIPVDTLSMGTSPITVSEYGRAVEYTSIADDLSKFNLENPVQKTLRNQMALVLDNAAAAAFKTTYVVAVPSSLSGITWDTDGTLSDTASQNLTVAHCGVIRDYMRDTLIVPWYNERSETYMSIASVKALRGIKNDPDFLAWRQYLRPGDVLFNSEVGQVEQIRFVESNNTSALSNAKGTGSVLGEAVIFGDDGVAMVEVETPELRAAIPGDFGRFKSIAWYGVLAFGLIWNATATAGEAKVILVSSA